MLWNRRKVIVPWNDQRGYRNRKIKLLCILIFCLGSVLSAEQLFISWLCFMYNFLLLIRCPTRKQNKDYAMYLLTVLYHESWVSISHYLLFLSRLLRKSLWSGGVQTNLNLQTPIKYRHLSYTDTWLCPFGFCISDVTLYFPCTGNSYKI